MKLLTLSRNLFVLRPYDGYRLGFDVIHVNKPARFSRIVTTPAFPGKVLVLTLAKTVLAFVMCSHANQVLRLSFVGDLAVCI